MTYIYHIWRVIYYVQRINCICMTMFMEKYACRNSNVSFSMLLMNVCNIIFMAITPVNDLHIWRVIYFVQRINYICMTMFMEKYACCSSNVRFSMRAEGKFS
jgi:hypothetical protein